MDVFSEDGVTHSDLQFFGVAVGAILVIVVNLQVSALVRLRKNAVLRAHAHTCPTHRRIQVHYRQTHARTHTFSNIDSFIIYLTGVVASSNFLI